MDRTKEGRESSIKFVWEFIHIATEWDTSGAQLVNLKHLRGACIRFLTSNPNNASLLLLKAFCTLVLEEERISVSKLITDARSEIKRGFDILREEGNTSMVDTIVSIEHYFDLLEGNSSRIELKELIQETRELQILHSNRNWLQTFNKNFMVNYE